MKILTLNTNSLHGEDYPRRLDAFVAGLLEEMPDIVALPEVNQTVSAGEMDPERLEGQYPVPGCIQIREDNHAAQVAIRLRQAGVECSWAWIPIKLGYEKFDEGVAILSLNRKIRCVDAFPISRTNDYHNWRTRAVLGVQVEGLEDWFYTVHMGWWQDELEPFLAQWRKLNTCLASRRMCSPVWLMGDFNSPDHIRREGYDAITACGWKDMFLAAQEGVPGCTVCGDIDGWRDLTGPAGRSDKRLDYIWCSQPRKIKHARVLFDGKHGPVVSDHYAVLVETVSAEE